jgi:probable F420-dependent oxidoreductase
VSRTEVAVRAGVVQVIDGGEGRGLEFIRATATSCEELGYSTFWLADHLVFFDEVESTYPYNEDGTVKFRPGQGIVEPLQGLLAAGLATTTIRLGTAVEVVALRHPIERAKQVATLDVLTCGRFIWGVGVGWMREEFEALGIDFGSRGRRGDEVLAACRALWTQERSSFRGEFFAFDGVIANPKPRQRPNPPILAGGTSRAALRRAARNDGWLGWNVTIDELDSSLAFLDEELERLGRTRDGFHLYLGSQVNNEPDDTLRQYLADVAGRGVEEYAFGLPLTPRRFRHQLEQFSDLSA